MSARRWRVSTIVSRRYRRVVVTRHCCGASVDDLGKISKSRETGGALCIWKGQTRDIVEILPDLGGCWTKQINR